MEIEQTPIKKIIEKYKDVETELKDLIAKHKQAEIDLEKKQTALLELESEISRLYYAKIKALKDDITAAEKNISDLRKKILDST